MANKCEKRLGNCQMDRNGHIQLKELGPRAPLNSFASLLPSAMGNIPDDLPNTMHYIPGDVPDELALIDMSPGRIQHTCHTSVQAASATQT